MRSNFAQYRKENTQYWVFVDQYGTRRYKWCPNDYSEAQVKEALEVDPSVTIYLVVPFDQLNKPTPAFTNG